MILRKNGFVLDIDVEGTLRYAQEHSLCNCSEDRNFYGQAREKFPKLTALLAEFGVLIDRPDEIGSCAVGDEIEYHFVSYTVIGDILEADQYEFHIFDGGLFLNVVVDHWYVPNEQRTDRYFTVTVLRIKLPWVLDEPFPEPAVFGVSDSLVQKLRNLFRKES